MLGLFDPEVAQAHGRAWEGGEAELLDAAGLGAVAVLNAASDGPASIAVFVDEPVEGRLERAVVRRVDDARLRVESGRVWVTGLEELGGMQPGLVLPSAPNLGDALAIEPGTYRLGLSELEWTRAQRRSALADAGVAAEPAWLNWAGQALGSSLIGSVLLAVGVAACWIAGQLDLRDLLLTGLMVLAPLALLLIGIFSLPPIKRLHERIGDIDRTQLPDFVAVLEPADDEAPPRHAAWLTPRAVEPDWTPVPSPPPLGRRAT